jgi:hypothetical protein
MRFKRILLLFLFSVSLFSGSLAQQVSLRETSTGVEFLLDGKQVLRNRWVTFADSRAGMLRITGWTGAQKSGYSDVFKDAIRRLNKCPRSLTFEDVFNEMIGHVATQLVLPPVLSSNAERQSLRYSVVA